MPRMVPPPGYKPLVAFSVLLGNPRMWQEVAHDLVCSANLLCEADAQRRRRPNAEPRQPLTWRTLMMLYGLAAENLIKGIIVARDSTIRNAERLPRWFANHD